MKRRVTGLALALAACAGCGGTEVDRLTLAPLSGTVNLDGKPLPGATISFVPVDKDGTPGGDLTGGDGTFKASYRNRPGLAPGKYKVVVARPKGDAKGGARELPPELTKSSYMAGLASAKGAPGAPSESEWLYGSAETTPLSHEVSAAGDTDLVFDLKSTAKK